MKINAKITLLASLDGVTIEIHDADARVEFLTLELTTDQFCAALGRMAMTSCQSAEVQHLERLGRKHECKLFEFALPENHDYKDRKQAAEKAMKAACPEGWVPEFYFGSHDSFFIRSGKPWARAIIRRWVDIAAKEYRRGRTEA